MCEKMSALFTVLRQDAAVQRACECYDKKKSQSLIYGLSGAQKHAVLAAAYAGNPKATLIITHNRETLSEWRENLQGLLPGVPILELPEVDMQEIAAAAKGVELMARRMDVLGRLLRNEKIIVLAKADAAVQKGISRQDFTRMSLKPELGAVLERELFAEQLVKLGYEHVDQVERIGQFSSRGGIVDIFPINSLVPIRIEFFDDEIDSLREFDLMTQRSIRNVDSCVIMPLSVMDADGKPEPVISYLPDPGCVVFDEPMRIREEIIKLVKENPEIKSDIFSWEDITDAAAKKNVLFISLMLQKLHNAEPQELVSIVAKAVAPFQRQMDMLASEARGMVQSENAVLILTGDEIKANSLREFFGRERIASTLFDFKSSLRKGIVSISWGSVLSNGFEIPGAGLVVITEKDIFGRQKKRIAASSDQGEKISHFRDIKPGDYVVHVNHGIGKYLGVKTLEVAGIHKDYLHIQYGGDDKLFVPTDQVHLLQKYIGAEGEIPRLHRMGGTEWAKAKARARASVEDIAKELIELYAKRQNAKGFAFSPDTTWQKEFEDSFPYEETMDQLVAIRAVKEDMEKPLPMDRLVCGDVGFGKTEVAIRAAFKAVMDGKQVAVLVPTTVLAQQHYQTFSNRFLNFGPTIDVISRFRTAKEQKQTMEAVAAGKVDILIGTHAILNQKKVSFRDLGLLIVDEEQRFGVKQKEKIKTLSTGVDVLTLSATPIPRTLHMSLVGARDMSIIETPPAERFPVQTYVVENNAGILKNAIRKEMKRGGQIYFVYNRVETIDKIRQYINELVPEARIQTAHGQMPEEVLERVMVDFYQGEYDILLATSIVENGLDVSNANTIIIYDADHFGLSQLYQMRGRVGRSKRMAFAYFVYQADKVLTETAEKRLQAIKEFAELGAGFKIAMRDLEIRGAGNLLGSQQHGHIAGVGFEMYCKLLEEAVQSLKTGEPVKEIQEPVIELETEAYLDGGYISDAMHKIEIYQRIAAIRKNDEIPGILDELIDRFGEPTKPVMTLLQIARIKNYARNLGVSAIIEKADFMEITFGPNPDFKPEAFIKLRGLLGSAVKVLPSQGMRIRLAKQHKKNITGIVLRIMMILSGEPIPQPTKKTQTVKKA